MPVNKVNLSSGEILIDISADTVTPETLAQGTTAHDATGASIVGTMTAGTTFTLTATTTPGATVTATLGDIVVTAVADASGTAVLTLPKAGTWTVVAEYNGQTSVAKTISVVDSGAVELLFISSTFNNNDWDVIAVVSDSDDGPNWWSIGDRKAVPLNGTVGAVTLSNYNTYAFILAFNHNPTVEGTKRIHLQLAKTALTSGKDIAFCDSSYSAGVTGNGYFSMNTTATNSGGWEASQMRKNICGDNLSSYSGTLLAVMPESLRRVLKSVQKYTNNTGKSTVASAVTATTDIVFLPSEFEVLGSRSAAHATEQTYQKQYAYYAAGNSKKKYNHQATNTLVAWYTRSPANGYSDRFVLIDTAGASNGGPSNESRGFAPCFCV